MTGPEAHKHVTDFIESLGYHEWQVTEIVIGPGLLTITHKVEGIKEGMAVPVVETYPFGRNRN